MKYPDPGHAGGGQPDAPAAMVVGLCSHGLASCRALAEHGVTVHAIESNHTLPGFRTRYATVHAVQAINGPGLIESLLEVRSRIAGTKPPVLLLMNDNMVREVAKRWDELAGRYLLSWSGCRSQVRTLTDKLSLEQRCWDVGLNYPQTWTIHSERDVAQLPADHPGFIVKPALPLGSFKARRCGTLSDVHTLVREFPQSLPFLIQQWIPGNDLRIQFSALYLDAGKILARFDGRKIESLPAALGQAIIVEAYPDDEVYEATCSFVEGLNFSGPMSLEVKRAPDGSLWVIEPTVGRTDTHFQCWHANGINMAYLEYCHVAGLPLPALTPREGLIWFDTERDPRCFLHHAWRHGIAKSFQAAVFPYADAADIRPFLYGTYRMFADYLQRRLVSVNRHFRESRYFLRRT